jgi:hypothetical protein
MPRFRFRHRRKPPDLYPEILQRLRDEEAARAAAPRPPLGSFAASLERQINETAAAVAGNSTQHPSPTETEAETQTAPPNPKSAPPPEQTSKEKQPMPSTILSQAKSALRTAAAPPSPSRQRGRTSAAAAKGKSSKSSVADNPDLDRHSRKCLVCNHPEREAIEELFINWHSPRNIRTEFGMYPKLDWFSIYRHARAVGLYEERRKNLRSVFDLVLESAGTVAPTAQGIVAIVRAYTSLTDTHQWIEPERRVHVTNHIYHHHVPAEPGVSAYPDEGTTEPDFAAEPLAPAPSVVPATAETSDTSAPEPSAAPVSLTAVAPSNAPASVLATSHSPLATAVSNRNISGLASPPTLT